MEPGPSIHSSAAVAVVRGGEPARVAVHCWNPAQQHQVQRRQHVMAAVVGRVRFLGEVGVSSPKRSSCGSLPGWRRGQRLSPVAWQARILQGRHRQAGMKGSVMYELEHASMPSTATYHGIPAAGMDVSSASERGEPQCGEVDEAAVVGQLDRVDIALDARRLVEPLVQRYRHLRVQVTEAGAAGAGPVLGVAVDAEHVDAHAPLTVRLEIDLEASAMPIGSCLRPNSRRGPVGTHRARR